MRKYTLASSTARANTDLRDYADIIEEAVHEVMPKADVRVEKDCYFVSPTPSQGAAIRIGRQICKSALSGYCIHIPKLFSSIEVNDQPKKEERKNEPKRKQLHGGHY